MLNGYFDVEVSLNGIYWVNATKSPVDVTEGTNEFDNTHYRESVGSTHAEFVIDWERCGARYIRFAFTPLGLPNQFDCESFQRSL
jgi:hypothetical protein